MGARRTDMHRLQEMVRLHRLGESSRSLDRPLPMGRETIRCYVRALRRAGSLDGTTANGLQDRDRGHTDGDRGRVNDGSHRADG